MNVEIDHFFEFVESEEKAREILTNSGFNIYKITKHAGQGTSGIFLMFEEFYLELIWLRDRIEASHNILRFDLRYDAFKDGGCPFGVAFRGKLPWKEENSCRYEPEYGAYTINFLNESLENIHLPLIFHMSNKNKTQVQQWHPVSYIKDRDQCNFSSAIKHIERIEIHSNFEIKENIPFVEFKKSLNHSAHIFTQEDAGITSLMKLIKKNS